MSYMCKYLTSESCPNPNLDPILAAHAIGEWGQGANLSIKSKLPGIPKQNLNQLKIVERTAQRDAKRRRLIIFWDRLAMWGTREFWLSKSPSWHDFKSFVMTSKAEGYP